MPTTSPATGATTTTAVGSTTGSAPPTVAASLTPFEGRSSCSDPPGDVQFPNPGADLTDVELAADETAITITWHTVGEVNPSDDIEWRAETWTASGRYDHFFIVSGGAAGLSAEVIEQGSPDMRGSGEVEVIESGIRATFPFASIPEQEAPALEPPFTWAGLTSGELIDGDYCPNRATPLAATEERATFE